MRTAPPRFGRTPCLGRTPCRTRARDLTRSPARSPTIALAVFLPVVLFLPLVLFLPPAGATAADAVATDATPTDAVATDATPVSTTTRDSVREGKRLFLAVGCYECHGTTGAGASTGPKLAPDPLPLPAFAYQLRHPIGVPHYGSMRMPPYGSAVLSDTQVAAIYAYLKSIKPGPPASRIPLLNH